MTDTIRLSSIAQKARLGKSPDCRHLKLEATRSARTDRDRYRADMATIMEATANMSNFGNFFCLIREAAVALTHPAQRYGSAHPGHRRKVTGWVEHFSQLLNPPPCGSPDDMSISAPAYDANCAPPTMEEIAEIFLPLKPKKAPGEDGLPTEICKSCLPTFLEPLYDLLRSIFE